MNFTILVLIYENLIYKNVLIYFFSENVTEDPAFNTIGRSIFLKTRRSNPKNGFGFGFERLLKTCNPRTQKCFFPNVSILFLMTKFGNLLKLIT